MSELEKIDWPQILDRLEKLATSEMGRSQLRKTEALDKPSSALESLQIISEFQAVIELGQRPFMESLDLYSTWFTRLEKRANLKTLELKDIRHFCIEALALHEILGNLSSPWIVHYQKQILPAEEPLSAIDNLMTPDGQIRNDASKELFRLYKEKESLGRDIQLLLDQLVTQHELEGILQDRYVTTREGRWVLPIKSGMQSRFAGIIHASSQSKQTVFMEPKEVVLQNNRLRELEVAIEEEIERLLKDLTEYLSSIADEIKQTKEVMKECDIRFAQAHLANQMQASSPLFTENEIELIEVRHPVFVLKHEQVVANNVKLNIRERILLLSGPNAGGKTVLLKAIGLAAQMARCGLPICAQPGSKLPFFSPLTVAVGDSQSVDAHLSTFAAHLNVLNRAADKKGLDQLLLVDEICGSTDPDEGAALARAFVEAYCENEVFAIITSHLGPLKVGWDENSGVVHGSLEYDGASGQPTYQLIMGVSGQSLAIQTAKRVGIKPNIIERALHHLSPQHKALQQKIDDLQSANTEIERIKKRLQDEFRETQKTKSKYEALLVKFERERESMLDQTLKRAQKKVENLIQFAQVDQTFKKHESLQKIKSDLPQLIKAKVGSQGPQKIDSPEEFSRRYPPGSRVFVQSVGRDGVIQGTPNSKGEVPILSNSMRLMVPWNSLSVPQQAQNPTADVIRKSAKFSYSANEGDRVVDLRGLAVEEALSQLEIQLDTAALNKEERVKIIHGHGTDTLKRAIRSQLSRSVYVKKWRSGTQQSGGDGVTWVEINE